MKLLFDSKQKQHNHFVSEFDFRDLQSRGDGKPLREYIVWVVPFLDLLKLGVIITKEDLRGIL